MAVDVTYRVGGESSGFGGDAVSGSFTPANGSLLVAVAGITPNSDGTNDSANDATISGGGLTWTRRVATASHATSDGGFWRGISIWTALVGTGASMAVTIGNVPAFADVAVYEVTGHDAADPVVQTASRANTYGSTSSGAGSFNLGAASDANGAVIAGMMAEDYGSDTITPGTSWVEGRESRPGSNSYHCQSQFIEGSVSTAAWAALPGYNWGWGGSAIEIRAAAAAAKAMLHDPWSNVRGILVR